MRNRLLAMAALGLSCAIRVQAGTSAAPDHHIEVYLGDDDSAQLFGSVQWLVSNIFDCIGIHTEFRRGEPANDPRRQFDEALAFVVHTVRHAPIRATAEALACSRIVGVFGREVIAYRDRLQALPAIYERNGSNIAGYVLAHELAHLISGSAEHAPAGILCARWSDSDLRDILFRKLMFTSADVARMRRGLAVQLTARRAIAIQATESPEE